MHNIFLLWTLFVYIMGLVNNGLTILVFVMANLIGQSWLVPEDPIFKLLYDYLALN